MVSRRAIARILITETQAGSLSRFRGRIVEVAVDLLLPVDQLTDLFARIRAPSGQNWSLGEEELS